jgi:shikimate dehydrogenase
VIRAAVLGQDVSKSRSPGIHRAAYQALGLEGTFEALSVDPAGFAGLVHALGERGYGYLNVTIPHKGAAAALAATRSAMVRNCGAANTLIFEPEELLEPVEPGDLGELGGGAGGGGATGGRLVHAENTDGYGLLAALRDLGAEPGGEDAVLVGAGGAAAGALEALTSAGARVRVVARRREAARALVARIPVQRRRLARAFGWDAAGEGARETEEDEEGAGGLAAALQGARIVVSSVPPQVWADGDRAAALADIARGTAVLEMAYGQLPLSPLGRAVRGRVARYADGLGMLVHQAVRAIELALGETPPLPPLFAAARNPR